MDHHGIPLVIHGCCEKLAGGLRASQGPPASTRPGTDFEHMLISTLLSQPFSPYPCAIGDCTHPQQAAQLIGLEVFGGVLRSLNPSSNLVALS